MPSATKTPRKIGLAGDEILVAAADHLHVDVAQVLVGHAVLDRRADSAGDGVGLHFDRQRRDQRQPAGVQIVAAADDQIRPLAIQRQRQFAGAVAVVAAIAQRDGGLRAAGECRPG